MGMGILPVKEASTWSTSPRHTATLHAWRTLDFKPITFAQSDFTYRVTFVSHIFSSRQD